MKIVLALLIVFLNMLLSITARAEVELSICHENIYNGKNWHTISLLQLGEILQKDGNPLELKVRRAVCNQTMPDTVCSAVPGRMFCKQESFRRMNMAASWYAARYILDGIVSYEQFRLKYNRPSARAFRYADGSEVDKDISRLQESIRLYIEQSLRTKNLPHVTDNLRRIATIQNRIMAFNIASLIGHEAHHLNEEVCSLKKKSRAEKSGLFAHILTLQTSKKLFCPSFPNPNEIKADRCAIRQIERLHKNPIIGWDDDVDLESFAQRAASDMIAFQSLTGFRKFTQLPTGKYIIQNLDEYLNPVYRLVLLSGSISNSGSTNDQRICGDSASLFVQGVQAGFEKCAGEGEVSDELLAELSKGIETSWNGAPWTEDSFSCSLK